MMTLSRTCNRKLRPAISTRAAFIAAVLAPLLTTASRGAEVPANLGLGLRGLVETHQRDRAKYNARLQADSIIQADDGARPTVNIHLDGSRPAEEVASDLRALGVQILLVDTSWRKGVISAHLPIEQAAAAAKMPGVRSVLLAPKPVRRSGGVTAESNFINRADQVNTPGVFGAKGILGSGISIGIVSDSFDTAQRVPRAEEGVRSGDLPGSGNPNGYSQPVVVIDDNFAPLGGQTDEGRAMAEIIHDIAPGAKLAFSTVQQTQSIMAFSIRNLRANKAASCDIIVDDVYFFDEPFFSDGQLALAVEDVVNGNSLPGKKVVYFSAAGNSGNAGYASEVRLLSPGEGLAVNNTADAPQRPLDFNAVPAALYAGGFHNVNRDGPPAIAIPVTSPSFPFIVFQWDDPFDAGAVTTDYNLLVFDEDGNYFPGFSGIDDNIATDEPLEFAFLEDPDATFYLVISLATPAPPTATQLRFISPIAPLLGPYIAYEAVSMAGHSTAASANAVGAYVYNSSPQRNPNYNAERRYPPPGPYNPDLEDFTSNGGVLPFYFDAAGRRLPQPVLRAKPDMAAADGVNTTFFGFDYENDGFPNFFGTSAAAPAAAAVAALVLDASGGPGKLTPTEVRRRLQDTAIPHDLDPFFARATAAIDSANVEVDAYGNATNDSARSPRFFTVRFGGSVGEKLNRLEINLTNVGLIFDEDEFTGYPFTVGATSGDVGGIGSVSADRRILTIDFAGSFDPGESISFGIDRDFERTGIEGNSADLLPGASISANVNVVQPLRGAFASRLGRGFTFADGHGLIDAHAAVETITGHKTAQTGAAANIATRAFVATDDAILIGGFIVRGSASKNVILRALGPSMQSGGVPVPGSLQDPTLQVFDTNGNAFASNDNWRDDPNQTAAIEASGFAPADPRESAILLDLGASNYTAIVRGTSGTTGNALVEVYDRDGPSATSELANLSSRGFVLTGDNVMIGGFVVAGGDPAEVVVRALGPSLRGASVSGALQDPTLTLHDRNGAVIAENDNWQQDSSQAIRIQETGLAPADALESAAALRLSAGSYTAVVRGRDANTGVSLIEMYSIR